LVAYGKQKIQERTQFLLPFFCFDMTKNQSTLLMRDTCQNRINMEILVSQEILTKKSAVSQETLTKKRALQACLVKKPLQKPFYHKNSPVLSGDCL